MALVTQQKISNTLKAAALVVLTIESAAFASSSWSQSPPWSAPSGESSYSPRRSYPSKQSQSTTSPFAPGSSNISLDVGQVFLMGDLGSKYSDSIGSQLHYTYGVSDMFGFDTSLGYSSHSDSLDVSDDDDKNRTAAVPTMVNGKPAFFGRYSMATLLTGLRANLTWYDKVIPHVVFGLGFYKPSYEFQTETISPLVFGVHAGPGIDLELTKQLFFGAALTFHDVFGTTKITQDGSRIDVGGTYTSFFLRAGITF